MLNIVQHGNALRTQQSPFKHGLQRWEWKIFEYSAEIPDTNLTEHLWNELDLCLHSWPPHPTSLPDLTNVFKHISEKNPKNEWKAFLEEYRTRVKWDFKPAHMGVMVRCPQSLGHMIYSQIIKSFN